jgi:hypothetical protein
MLKTKCLPPFLWLLIIFELLASCQKDIPVAGQDDQGNVLIIPRDSAWIRSITLMYFDSLDGQGVLWDTAASTPYDSLNFQYPDIFFNIGIYDTLFPLSFYQASCFFNVDPRQLPITYQMVPPVYIPAWGKPFHIRVYDREITIHGADSTFMDSVLFVVQPDFTLPNPYVSNFTSTGAAGVELTLGVIWQ